MAVTNDMFSYNVDTVDPSPLITIASPNYLSSCAGVNQLSTSGYVQLTTGNSTNLDYRYQYWNQPSTTGEPWGYGQQYVPQSYPTAPWIYGPQPPPTQQQEKPLNLRGIFEVFAVCIKDDDIYSTTVVAKDEATARIKAFQVLDLDDPDDFTFIVRRVGDLPARKEVQKVKIVKDSE